MKCSLTHQQHLLRLQYRWPPHSHFLLVHEENVHRDIVVAAAIAWRKNYDLKWLKWLVGLLCKLFPINQNQFYFSKEKKHALDF